jgi:hypothetical protein
VTAGWPGLAVWRVVNGCSTQPVSRHEEDRGPVISHSDGVYGRAMPLPLWAAEVVLGELAAASLAIEAHHEAVLVGADDGPAGGPHVEAAGDQLRDEQLTLVPVRGGDEDHVPPTTRSPAIHTPRIVRVAAMSTVGSSASSTRSARRGATRPRSRSPKCSAAMEVAASSAWAGANGPVAGSAGAVQHREVLRRVRPHRPGRRDPRRVRGCRPAADFVHDHRPGRSIDSRAGQFYRSDDLLGP